MDTLAWHLVCSKARQERVAAAELSNQGYRVYMPECVVKRRRRGRLVEVTEPLFSRYLFVSLFSVDQSWAPVRSTRGVQNMVRFGSSFARASEALVNGLQALSSDGSPLVIESEFMAGQSVSIVSGPLAGVEGVFVRSCGQERAVVLLNFLQQQREVSVFKEQLL